MAERGDYFLKEIFPGASTELALLFRGAVENANLLRSDCFTIRDWMDIGECPRSEEAHALLLLMMTALEEGSLCLEIAEDSLSRRLADLAPDADAGGWARRLVNAIRDLPGLVGQDAADNKPLILRTLSNRQFLYFQKYLRAELDFQSEIAARVALPTAAKVDHWPAIVRDVLKNQPFPLDADQQMALAAALLNDFVIISGGPGTGKTSIVLTLLRCLVRGGMPADRIALAAPTGRAAQRLSDAFRAGVERQPGAAEDAGLRDLSASTLHRLLGYRPTRNLFTRHKENPIAADVVIVDEVSMVGLVLMSQLLQASTPETKLVLLGDKDQLPSVDAGAILASLIPADFQNGFNGDAATCMAQIFPHSPRPLGEGLGARALDAPMQNRIVLLQTNHRSQEQIRAAADAINRQDASLVERLTPLDWCEETRLDEQSGCFFAEQVQANAHEIRAFVQRWSEESYFKSQIDGKTLADWLDEPSLPDAERARRLFPLLDRFRLLTLVRDGAWGCDDINRAIEIMLRPRLDSDARSPLFAGAPVLITRNDAALGLFNGDLGIALREPSGSLRVLFKRQEGCVSFPAESLPAHELGFALTVHKSQGSEYRNVMLILPPTGGRRLLTKELIYTAITRAKSLAVICSTKAVLACAIGRKIVRESAMGVK